MAAAGRLRSRCTPHGCPKATVVASDVPTDRVGLFDHFVNISHGKSAIAAGLDFDHGTIPPQVSTRKSTTRAPAVMGSR